MIDNKTEADAGEKIHLSEYTEYDLGALDKLFTELKEGIASAEAEGFTDVYVRFSSTLDPYEDNTTGPVEVTVRGMREWNQKEKAWQAQYIRIHTLAKELGISQYEASVVDNLRARGKL